MKPLENGGFYGLSIAEIGHASTQRNTLEQRSYAAEEANERSSTPVKLLRCFGGCEASLGTVRIVYLVSPTFVLVPRNAYLLVLPTSLSAPAVFRAVGAIDGSS